MGRKIRKIVVILIKYSSLCVDKKLIKDDCELNQDGDHMRIEF
jgi:hypothetical protein